MANWVNKGVMAEAQGHYVEIINGSAIVGVGTEFSCTYSLGEMQELAVLYTEAVLHMTGAAPTELVRVGIGHVFQENDPEPPVGTYLRDNTGDFFWYRDSTGWHIWGRGSRTWAQGGYSWADVCDSWAPLTVIDGDDPGVPWNVKADQP